MNVLIGCEVSGTVREAFRARGHNAWSNDIQPAQEGSSFHLQGDVLKFTAGIYATEYPAPTEWDLLIAHPECTYLTNSAEWAYGDGPYHQNVKPETLVGAARRTARAQAVEFFMSLWNCGIPKICIENPVGCMSRYFRPADQYIQPHQFGEDASKATGLWLKNLAPLRPTLSIAPRVVNGRPRWANQTDSGQNRLSPSPERAGKRAETYPGIAAAMAAQWG